MNARELEQFVKAGDIATIEQYRLQVYTRDQRKTDQLVKLRMAERALIKAIDVAREQGKLAKLGAEVGARSSKYKQLADYGITWRTTKPFAFLGPKHITDEAFEKALYAASREKNLSRENIARIAIDGPRRPYASDRNEMLAKHLRIRPERVVAQTVDTLRGLCEGLELLDSADYDELDPELVREWSREVNESKRVINQLAKELAARG